MLLTGKGLASRREADSYLARAEKAEENVGKLVATVADLTAVSKLQKAVIDAAITNARNGISVGGDEP